MNKDKTRVDALLFDFYGELLPEKQKRIYEAYYFLDYSLAEIAENEGLTRQGVRDALARAVKALDDYEKKLCLSASYNKKTRLINEITSKINELLITPGCENPLSKNVLNDVLSGLTVLEAL